MWLYNSPTIWRYCYAHISYSSWPYNHFFRNYEHECEQWMPNETLAISTVSTTAFISCMCQHDWLHSLFILCHYPEWIQVGIRFTQPISKFDNLTKIMCWSRLMVLQTKTTGCNNVEAVIHRRWYYSHTEAGLLGNPSAIKRIEVRLIFCCLISHSAPDLIATTQHVSAS